MLDKIRENSRSIGTYIVFAILILVFVAYFGPGSNGCMGMTGDPAAPTYAARVNGEEVPLREFREQYDLQVRMYAAQMGDRWSPEMAEQLHLQDTVLERMVDRTLVVQAARKAGLSVGDDQLAAELRKIPSFQKNGHFDFDTYQSALASRGTTSDEFERDLREDLLVTRFVAQLRQAAVVTDDEVRQKFEKDRDRARLAYVRFPASEFAGTVAVSPEEVQAFLATAEGKKAVEDQYEREKTFRFEKPRRVSAQHILVKVEEDAPAADVDAARTRLEAARDRVAKGEDFGKVAEEVSEDPSTKSKGGDLGLFGPGSMVKPFEEAAMALQPGQISEPVRSRFGWHLIKVNDVKVPESTPRDEALQTVAREQLTHRKAQDTALQKATEGLALAASAGKPLTDLFPRAPADATTRPEGVFSGETSLFQAQSQYVPAIGVAPAIASELAQIKEAGKLLPRPIVVSGDAYILQVLERQQPDPAELEKEKETIREDLASAKAQKLVEGFTKQLRASAQVERNPQISGAEEAPAEG